MDRAEKQNMLEQLKLETLDARGRREEAEEKLLVWLDQTIARLEKELAQS